MRISDWSSDVCSSDLPPSRDGGLRMQPDLNGLSQPTATRALRNILSHGESSGQSSGAQLWLAVRGVRSGCGMRRSEEHTSELQSLMRIPSAVFCLTKKMRTVLIHFLHHSITD